MNPLQTLSLALGAGFSSGLNLYATIATLGTPRDVTLQEICIECFFPMDDATAEIFRLWAKTK